MLIVVWWKSIYFDQKFNLTEVALDFAKNTYEIKNFMTYNIVIFIKTAN